MKKEPFIFHSPDSKNLPRITIVGQIDGNKLLIGGTKCSIKDQFVKKTGVALAKERILNGNLITTLELQEGESLSYQEFITIAVTIAQTIITKGLKPLVLIPSFHWDCVTKKEFDEMEMEMEIEFIDEQSDIDEDGFVMYNK